MGILYKCWYWNRTNRERVGERPAHIIESSRIEENPAGCEGNVFTSYCGKEIESWQFAPFELEFGSLENALQDGAEICKICLGKKEASEKK